MLETLKNLKLKRTAPSFQFQFFRDGNQLLIGCVKNPVGKATNGRDMKKENWTK